MDVFVYGTLTETATVDSLLESYAFLGGARVDGVHVAAGTYPTLLPGGEAAGRLLRTDEVATLDRYEGVDSGLYVRVPLPRADVEGFDGDGFDGDGFDGDAIRTYVGDPAALGVEGEWPGEGSLAELVRAYVDRAGVTVRPTA